MMRVPDGWKLFARRAMGWPLASAPAVPAAPTSAERASYAESDAGKTARAAIGLCLDSPTACSMTPRQLQVFLTLCRLQSEEAGLHSHLPNVMEALLWVARRPWWDAGTAGIPDEAEDSLDPCER